jgi:periplasmic divalent cation tolerance protein
MTADAALICLVSVPEAHARTLARGLVERRLCACVHVPAGGYSVYRWEGAIEEAQECQLVIKTTQSRFAALKQAILQHHPYELPEILAVSVADAHIPYLDWLLDACAEPSP